MSGKRILFVIGTMSGGGSERRMIDLLHRLDRRLFAPELYLAYRTGELLPEVPSDVPVHAFTDGPRETTFGQRWAGKLRLLSESRMLDLHRLLRRQRFELIFAWGLRRAYETAWPARRNRVARAVYCVQDPAAEIRVDFPFQSPWRQAVSRWSYRSADRIFANSTDLCRRVEQLYRLPRSAVEPMVNLKDFQHLDQLAKEAVPNWPATGVRLLTVGRLQEQKGQALLIEAMDDLVHRRGRDVQLVICGQGVLEQTLREQIAQRRLTDRVQLAGFVGNPYPYYRTADLFVLPSLWEGLPNTLLEAVGLGTPSIAADCPTGPREILEGGRIGTLVPPGDVQALTNAIDEALIQLPELKLRAESARPAVRAKYDLSTGIRRVEQQLLNVITTAQQPTG